MLIATTAGAQEATYVIRGSQLPAGVVANGYVQSVTTRSPTEVLVRVTTALTPVGSNGSYGRFQGSPASGVPEGFTIPAALGARLVPDLGAWEAATEVLKWVSVNVELDEEPAPQDAVSVLHRGSGRCSGVANAATALLLAAGFEARTVSGLLISDKGVVPHRWVSCRLPDAGWVPTDPTLGLWAVTPNHVAFSDTVEILPDVEIVERQGEILERLPRWRGLPVRPNVGSELVCRLVGDGAPASATAILTSTAGDVRRVTLAPEGRFDSLLPGWWRLVVMADGGTVLEQRRLRLEPSQIHIYTVDLAGSEDGEGTES
jgi:hypothetical protein